MMPEVWEDIGAARLSGFNALAPWRFEPLTENNPADSAWMCLSSSQREMESLTRALQLELCDVHCNNEVSFAASLWKCKAENKLSSDREINNVGESIRSIHFSENNVAEMNFGGCVFEAEEKGANLVVSNAFEAEKVSNLSNNHHKSLDFEKGKIFLRGGVSEAEKGSNLSKNIKSLESERGKSLLAESLIARGKTSDSLSVNRAGKMSKRRSRAACKTPITFLNADPANFRAMVQQVTGVPLNPNGTRMWPPAGGGGRVAALLKPEPKRLSSTSSAAGIIQGLPTLDTSALFIHSARQNRGSAEFRQFPPAAPPRNEIFITEKLRSACVPPFTKHNGDFAVDEVNIETDSWLNASNLDGILIGSSGELAGSLPV